MDPPPPHGPPDGLPEQFIDVDDTEERDELEENDNIQSAGSAKPKRPRAKPPTDRTPGQSLLPHSKVEAIAQSDVENGTLSKEAMFMLTVATEEFIKRLAQSAHGRSELDRRSMIHYRDLASTAYYFEEFQFLQDTVPLPMPLHRALALRAAKEQGLPEDEVAIHKSQLSSASISMSKGKGKARASNGRSIEKFSDKTSLAVSASTERVRDNKGRWSHIHQESISAGISGSAAGAEDVGEGTSALSNGSNGAAKRALWNGSGVKTRPQRAWAPYPSPSIQRDVPSSVQIRSSNGHQPNGLTSSSSSGTPLWTRIPLPPTPSASSSQTRYAQQQAGQAASASPLSHPEDSTHRLNRNMSGIQSSPNHSPSNHHSSKQTTSKHFSHRPPHSPHENHMHPASPPSPPREPKPPSQGAVGLHGDYYAQMGQNPGRTIYSHQHRIEQ